MAALILTRTPPAHLLALECKSISELKKSGVAYSKTKLRWETIRKCQTAWNSTQKDEWTKKFIPDIERWIHDGPNLVSFHMSQALTNHGCFQKYLHSRARTQHPSYLHYLADIDDVEHTIFVCPFWAEERAELVQSLRRHSLLSDAQDLLCGPLINQLPTDNVRKRRILETVSKLSKLFTKMVKV